MGCVGLVSALCKVFPAHLAQPLCLTPRASAFLVTLEFMPMLRAVPRLLHAASAPASKDHLRCNTSCRETPGLFLGTAHSHPIGFPACNSQKRCELYLYGIPCLHLSGTSVSHLTVKAKRGRYWYQYHRVCSLLAFFGSPVGYEAGDAAKCSSGMGKADVWKCNFWGRNVQMTMRASSDVKDQKAPMWHTGDEGRQSPWHGAGCQGCELGSALGNCQLRCFGRARGQIKTNTCSYKVYGLLPLDSSVLKAGQKDCQAIQRLFRDT